MKKAVGLWILIFMLFGLFPVHAEAAESDVKMIFADGFYGGLAGALVGAAFMAFSDHPKDHWNNVAIGAGIGVLAGTLYGVGRASRAFAEIHDGELTVQAPTIRLNLHSGVKGNRPGLSADLLRIPF
jgi:hypothetical protein